MPKTNSVIPAGLHRIPVRTKWYASTKRYHAGDTSASASLFLHIGLQTGVLIRTEVDPLSGRLSDQRMRFLGVNPPTLLPVTAAGSPAMMALSAWPWLGHVHNGKFQLVPLAYDAVDYVAPFASDKVGEGLVAVVANAAGTGTLRVLTIDRLGEPFTQRVLKLGFTPRKLLVDEQLQLIITVEADQGMDSYPQRGDLQVRRRPRPTPADLSCRGLESCYHVTSPVHLSLHLTYECDYIHQYRVYIHVRLHLLLLFLHVSSMTSIITAHVLSPVWRCEHA